MCYSLLASFLLILCSASAVEFTIESPEKGDTWPKSSMTKKELRWRDKDKVLVAEVTFSDENYAGSGTPVNTEDFEFTIPGVTYDPVQRLFFVLAPNGDKVAIAQRTKVFLGTRIDLCKIATIHVSRFKSDLELALVVNTKPPAELPATEGGEGTRSISLDGLINH